jgi:hypothetical protein
MRLSCGVGRAANRARPAERSLVRQKRLTGAVIWVREGGNAAQLAGDVFQHGAQRSLPPAVNCPPSRSARARVSASLPRMTLGAAGRRSP